MFSKVLVAEDYEIANHGILKILHDNLGISDIQEAKYCDDAYLKFRKAKQEDNPFQLLITDLSFKPDHNVQTRTSGIDLINDIRAVEPEIKVIVYSQESRPEKIKMLFDKLDINGYVCKGQHAIKELISCVTQVYQGKTVLPTELTNRNDATGMVHLDDFDMMLLEDLAQGLTKREIVAKLKQKKIKPNSESMIDKRVTKLFDEFKARNSTHLVAIVKDLGLL